MVAVVVLLLWCPGWVWGEIGVQEVMGDFPNQARGRGRGMQIAESPTKRQGVQSAPSLSLKRRGQGSQVAKAGG